LLKIWIFILGEYDVTFDYLARKKNVAVVTDVLSYLDIHSLKIQEESGKELTVLLSSENVSISNIK
jgi:hypothetical protein